MRMMFPLNRHEDRYRVTAARVLGQIRMLSWAENHTVKMYNGTNDDGRNVRG